MESGGNTAQCQSVNKSELSFLSNITSILHVDTFIKVKSETYDKNTFKIIVKGPLTCGKD